MDRPLILALDPATRMGVCEGRTGDTPRLSAINFRRDPSDEPEDIYGRATHFLADRLRSNVPDLLAIEQPFPSQRFDTSLISIGLYAIFTGIAHCKGVRTVKAPIQTWRKYFIGRGNLPGPQAKRECLRLCEALGWPAPTHDAAEAAGIWSWACAVHAPQSVRRVEPLFVAEASA